MCEARSDRAAGEPWNPAPSRAGVLPGLSRDRSGGLSDGVQHRAPGDQERCPAIVQSAYGRTYTGRAALAERIKHFFEASGGTYGSPRITLDLWAEDWKVSVNTVAEIMAELGLYGREPKKRRSLTRRGKRPAARDLVWRHFDAVAPNLLWVGDMTEIDTGEGKLYLATVIDLFSRRLLGYAMGDRHDAALVSASLRMAAATRGGSVDGVIFHSDRGSEGGFNWSSQHLNRVEDVVAQGRARAAILAGRPPLRSPGRPPVNQ
ncbi:DDE-type integrase/transposase/recombinase, partial [Actinacidiphila oryziradicis]|uniref:DDE-type integrase/transposase/recombinase n=1 Tax=Actinacidiphila oryziradicis TaxID=2571141 RepID=UPI00145C50FC